MKNNQGVLKKIENLLQPESTILVDIQKKIDDNNNIINRKAENINKKQEKIQKIEEEIINLNEENSVLTEAFETLKDKDLKLITNVLKLSVDVKKDWDKLVNQFPLQIEIRKNDINDLNKIIEEDQAKLEDAKNSIKDLEASLETAYSKQDALRQLIKEAISDGCMRTRAYVIEVLKGVKFTDADAYETAKLIMFPEDELVPYFKNFKFEEIKNDEEIYVDLDNIVESLKNVQIEEPASEKKKEEESKPNDFLSEFEEDLSNLDSEKNIIVEDNADASIKDTMKEEPVTVEQSEPVLEETNTFQDRLEDETPISFEELRDLFNNKTTDIPEDNMVTDTTNEKLEDEETAISLEELQKQINCEFKKNLDNNTLENTKEEKSNEIPVQNITEEVKEEPKEITFDTEKLGLLEKRECDIKLIKPFDTTTLEPDKLKEILKARKIDVANVGLVIYKNGLQNYLDNLDALSEYGYKPSSMEIQKNGNILCYISNADLYKNLKTLKDYKIDLKMPSGHLAFNVLAVEPKELIDRIDMLIENKQSDLITYDVNALSLDVNAILKRIAFCIEYNIPYTEEKNNVLVYNSYVFNQKVLESLVEKEVNLGADYKRVTDGVSGVIDGSLLEVLKENLNSDKEIKLTDADKFDEFTRLEQKLESICVCKGNAYIIKGMSFSKENTKRNLITLINNVSEKNDKDLLIASLFYNSYKTLDDLKVALESM